MAIAYSLVFIYFDKFITNLVTKLYIWESYIISKPLAIAKPNVFFMLIN